MQFDERKEGIDPLTYSTYYGVISYYTKNAPRANSKADIEKTGLTFRNMPLIISSCTNSSNPNSSHMNYFVWKYMKEGKDGEKEENWS